MANMVYRNCTLLFLRNGKKCVFIPHISLSHRRYCCVEKRATRYFTAKHEWLVVSGDTGTVGISQHAQQSLGDVVFVQLPKIGDKVVPTKECGVLESVKAASELYSPVSGTVTEINEALDEKPELINISCYDDGWLFKLKLNDPKEITALMDENAYKKFLVDDSLNLMKD